MTALDSLTDTLSRGLNRTVAPALLRAVVRIYKQSPAKEHFAAATQALGFPGDLASALYVYVNDNIGALEAEAAAAGGAGNTCAGNTCIGTGIGTRKPAPAAARQAAAGKRRVPIALAAGVSDDEDARPAAIQGVLAAGGGGGERVPRPITFKKIKKADASRLKLRPGGRGAALPGGSGAATAAAAAPQLASGGQTSGDCNGPPEDHEEQSRGRTAPGCSGAAGGDSAPEPGAGLWPDVARGVPDEPATQESIDNDRDWYTLEDSAMAAVDQYRDLETEYAPAAGRGRGARLHRSGGTFSALGEYHDHDHEGHVRRRVPILAHFIVPPFLRGLEHHLTLQSGPGRTGRSAGPSVDPVKDPESELAVSARTGSFVIRDRKEKAERASQARERVAAPGTTASTAPPTVPPTVLPTALADTRTSAGERNVSPVQTEAPAYSFETIQRQRRALPAFQVRAQLLKVVAENQIVVVIGETGSGKTTQITQFLAEEGYTRSLHRDGTRRLVACTQPRRVAAMSVAKRVSEEMGVRLGEDVGYTIRFEDRTSHRKTRIKYMTEGILLREILEDPLLEQYTCVIMDEAHERSLNTDVLLGLFRNLLRRRRDLKLIVTSATMNADRFTRYFGNAPQFFIPGRTFPVEVFYAKSRCADYVETAVKQVVTIHLANKKGDGDILVFMTGQEDIEATCDLIHEKLALLENPPPLDVYPIYSTLPADVQKKIFTKQNTERRKVVVATNIAETSLTVDGIRYVVDCGLVKMKLFNPKLGMDALQVVPISMANAQQRSGRAGRTAPGLAYRLYTELAALPNQMFAQPIPEIQRTNLSAVMLLLKSLHVQDIAKFPFLDSPPLDLLTCSLYELWAMGALENMGNLTPLGSQMTSFPMEPTLAKLIILSCKDEFHCASEIITIVAMLSVPSVFYRPKERADEADAMRERFLIADLDHLTLLNVFTQWEQRAKANNMTMGKLATWSGRNFLHHKSLLRAKEVRTQLETIMVKLKYPLLKAKDDADIRKCICAAYFHQLASLEKMSGGRGQAEYSNLRQSYMKMYLHPTSALVGGADISPQYVVYDELVLTKKEYMQCVTAVEPEWLLEFGFVFYGVDPKVRKELESERGIKLMDPSELERQMTKIEATTTEYPKTITEVKRMKIKRNF